MNGRRGNTNSNGGGDGVGRGELALDDLEQLHDVSGREKVRSNDLVGTVGRRSNLLINRNKSQKSTKERNEKEKWGKMYLIDVEGGGVGAQKRRRLANLIETSKHLSLDFHALKDGFDHHVDLLLSISFNPLQSIYKKIK